MSEAEEKLDEATREVASKELTKGIAREDELRGFRGTFPGPYVGLPFKPGWRTPPLRWLLRRPARDPDPTSEEGLRDVLHEHDPKQ